MNERIKELAVEAGLKYHNWITNESNVKDGDFKYPRFEDYEKFAELIVRECIEQASISNGHGNNQWDKALTFAAKNIKEHFGVEE